MTGLQPGDEIRVIAPSGSAKTDAKSQRRMERSQQRLEALGYKVTFGKHLNKTFHFGTARREDRAEDFNDAYADKNVKAIMTLRGGWAANEILPNIDWDVVRANPKPLIGFSDITVLLNAVYGKAGVVGYLGPGFTSVGSMTSWRYTLDNLNAVLRQELPRQLTRSREWGRWPSQLYKTQAWKVLQSGEAEGVLLGGNLGTFFLLQGTEYQPKFDEPFILVAEDDDEAGVFTAREFSRRLESILQLPNVRQNMCGVIIGRFLKSSGVSIADVVSIVASKGLGDIPVIADVDFGHTLPLLTLPIGGKAQLLAQKGRVSLTVL